MDAARLIVRIFAGLFISAFTNAQVTRPADYATVTDENEVLARLRPQVEQMERAAVAEGVRFPLLNQETRLHIGDVVHLHAFSWAIQNEDYGGCFAIGGDGTIRDPRYGDVTANGRTPSEIEAELQHNWAAQCNMGGTSITARRTAEFVVRPRFKPAANCTENELRQRLRVAMAKRIGLSAQDVPPQAAPIHAGDILFVRYGRVAATLLLRVAADGSVDSELLGRVQLGGMTPENARLHALQAATQNGLEVEDGRLFTVDRIATGDSNAGERMISPGDILWVSAFNLTSPNVDTADLFQVPPDGAISPYLLWNIKVTGMKEREVPKTLEKGYDDAGVAKQLRPSVLRLGNVGR